MQMQDLIGQQLGNYRLTALLGKGGFAKVYLGEHIFLGNQAKAAIKVLNETQLNDEDRQNFLTEARTIRKLNHPHIVKLLEFGIEVSRYVDASIPYLVMDYALHGTLRDRHARNTAVPMQQIMAYVNQITDGLQYAHDQGIVHRDVKPENMLVMGINDVVLSDFGIAVTGHDSINFAQTKDGFVRGTFVYSAPERFRGTTRRASDQYSLGIVVYEWLTGVYPFKGTPEQIIYNQIHNPPPPLYGAYPYISQEIEVVVMRALAKEPEQRYPSVKDFAQALNAAIQSVAQSQLQPPLGQSYAGRPEQRVDPASLEKRVPPAGQQVYSDSLTKKVNSEEYPEKRTPSTDPQVYSDSVTRKVNSEEYPEKRTPSTDPQVYSKDSKEKVDPRADSEDHTRPAAQHIYQRPQQRDANEPLRQPNVDKEQTIYSRQPVNPGERLPAYSEQQRADSESQLRTQQANINRQYPPPEQPPQVNLDYQTWQQLMEYRSERASRPKSNFNLAPLETPVEAPVTPLPKTGLSNKLVETLRTWFELDHDFARLPKNKTFRTFGMVLNVLSAVLIGVLAQPPSAWLIFAALLYSLVLFNLCIRLVNVKFSMAAGLLVALYWGYVGIIVWEGIYTYGPYLPKISPFLIAFLSPSLIALFFFSASAYLHIRYVMNRLP